MRVAALLIALLVSALFYHSGAEVPEHIAALGGVEQSRTDRTTTYALPSGMLATVSTIPVNDGAAYGAVAGPSGPATCAGATRSGSSQNWNDVTFALTSNNIRSSTTALSGTQYTNYLKCTDFGFALGGGQQLVGIQVNVEVSSGQNNRIFDGAVRLVTADTIDTANDRSKATTWPTADTILTHGGAADLWGRSAETFFPSDVNDPTFGVAISARHAGSGTAAPLIDAVTMTIFHYPPKGPIFISAFETREDELDWTNALGTTAYSASAARTGSYGLELTSSAAGVGARRCAPTTFVDTDIILDGYNVANVTFDETFPEDSRMVVMEYLQGGPSASTRGCYLEAIRTSAGVDLSAWYSGTPATHLYFGTVSVPLGSYTVELDQRLANSQILCQLWLYDSTGRGGSQWDAYATMIVDECPGTICEIDTVCLGGAASLRGNSMGPGTLKFDDWVLANFEPVGIPAVHALTPPTTTDAGATWGWSSNGSSRSCNTAEYNCIKDWTDGVADLHGSGGADVGVRHESTLTTTLDQFNVSDPPTPTTRQTVKAVGYYASGANLSSPSTFIRPFIVSNSVRSNGVDSTVPNTTPVALRGIWADDPQPTPTGTPANAPTWAPTRVQGLKAGYERDTVGNDGDASVTAVLLYEVLTTPPGKPDINLQDHSRDGALTAPEISMSIGTDSISAGTLTANCTDATGICSLTPCTTDADCTAIQSNGLCVYTGYCQFSCTTNADCTCGVQPVCQGDKSIINQMGADIPSLTNLVNYGRSGNMLKHFEQSVPEILVDMADHMGDFSQAATLAKGRFGHCSATTSHACKTTASCPTDTALCCPGGETCIPHGIDYVWGKGGYWENLGEANIQNCTTTTWLSHELQTTGLKNCPAAVPTVTPGAYQVAQHECTNLGTCATFTPTGTRTPTLTPPATQTPGGPTATATPVPTECTADGQCGGSEVCVKSQTTKNDACSAFYGVHDSTCMNVCAGKTNPAWFCTDESRCGECASDATRRCSEFFPPLGFCSAPCDTDDDCGQYKVGATTPTPTPNPAFRECYNGVCLNWGDRCDGDGDCPNSSTCYSAEAYPVGQPGYGCCGGNAFNSCPSGASCNHNECSSATRICSAPCDAKTCTTDADCGDLGGICDGGRCAWCGAGGSGGPNITTAIQRRAAEKAWIKLEPYGSSPQGVVDTHESIRAVIEGATYRRRYLASQYGLSFYGSLGPYPWPGWEFNLRVQKLLPRNKTLKYLDTSTRTRAVANMITGGDEDGIIWDGAHYTTFAVAPEVESTAGWMNNAFPVCSGEPDQLCGACFASCSADVDCNKPTPSFTATPITTLTPQPTPTNAPTYTPVTGACAAGWCKCTADNQCASGQCALNAIPNLAGAGTPTPTPGGRCLGEAHADSDGKPHLFQCPAGNGAESRRLIASDNVCATRTPGAGLCSEEITRPRCVDSPKRLCTRDTDCPTGGPCSHNAVLVSCQQNADCNGNGMDANDVCTNDPTRTVGATTPTPTATEAAKHCRQPTPA